MNNKPTDERLYSTFAQALITTRLRMQRQSQRVAATRWQSIDLPDTKHMHMRELFDYFFRVELENTDIIDHWAKDIKPNLPWAETAFQERVSGLPWNPGIAWETWPWAKHAETFKPGRFSHSYAERYWPKYADDLSEDQGYRQSGIDFVAKNWDSNRGIAFDYGDLDDVAKLLYREPLTRQAFLPMWFPEDTGVVHGERVPCSLGYHFMYRDGKLSIIYLIRSCDMVRHLRDDLYMTMRLLIWMLKRLREMESPGEGSLWRDAQLGVFSFKCFSLHMFEADWQKEYGGKTSTKSS